MVSFLFPGQGSQEPGMGKALADAYPAARQVFEEADDALGFSLSALCFEGSEAELVRTEITQPAILATSIAALAALRAERPDLAPRYAAGHSLGEWSALVAVGALRFADAVRLVRERGRLMQLAVPEGQGAMAAVMGLEAEQIRAVCAEVSAQSAQVVVAANYNSKEQTVISGTRSAVEAAKVALEGAGAKKVALLAVSAPFHSPLMEPAARGLAEALRPIEVGRLTAPVITNVEARPNQDPERVKALLVAQVTAPVRWVETATLLLAEGEATAIEVGPGRVLAGLAKRIDRALTVLPTQDPASLQKALAALA